MSSLALFVPSLTNVELSDDAVDETMFFDGGDLKSVVGVTQSEWCLILEDKESVSEETVVAIKKLISSSPADVSAYEVSQRSFIGLKQINATGWDASKYQFHVRLFRRSDVLWTDFDGIELKFAGRVIQLDPTSDVFITSALFRDITDVFRKFDAEATVEAKSIIDHDEVPSPIRGLRSGLEEFVRRYSPEEDGVLSWVLSYAHMHERFVAHAKAVEMNDWQSVDPLPSRDAAIAAWNAFWRVLVTETIVEERKRITLKLEQDRNVEDAIQNLRRLLSSWGEDAGLLSDLSNLEYSLGFYDAALAHCRRAVELNPDDSVAVTNLSRILESSSH